MSRRTSGPRSRLRPVDALRLGTAGMRARPARALLSALGIAIGIAAMVAVVSLSASSRERLDQQLAALGTNLLTAEPADATPGSPPPLLPATAAGRARRIAGVQRAGQVAEIKDVAAYRNRFVPVAQSNGLAVMTADPELLAVVGGRVASGRWLGGLPSDAPGVVLGSVAAERLGVRQPGGTLWVDGHLVGVAGVLRPIALASELDAAVLVPRAVARRWAPGPLRPTRVYVRADDAAVRRVSGLLGPSLQPQDAATVAIGRPSDALAARDAADAAFTGLLLGLGAVALLVGGIGVVNTMVISVLERRREIGLRRALGATRGQIRIQFLAEALVLSIAGGFGGAALGAGVSVAVARLNDWIPVVPPWVLAGAVGATTVIGALAGLYPAVRAARTPPTVALSSA
ncbi:ABC transporter permease [Patulibacter defluvii]|uniref:ABC transporter permease n=1 Tax=Patulibacter defluvii TaxID=3095358 RepID=UPI002A75DC1C|nr:ABC transporter permease [Patulibacter sp. DM4]